MKVVFRADASHHIGSGHVMRCLTLADALTNAGATCQFICRAHNGHLADYIRSKNYPCHLLNTDSKQADIAATTSALALPRHAKWLGVRWRLDAKQTATILDTIKPNWLVVDHYSLDNNWEQALHSYCRHVMVIDDLADRPHFNADVLLDQTLGRQDSDYRTLVSPLTKLLLGPEYALLRPEFTTWREVSLKRREKPILKKILVNLGGMDNDNVTRDVLDALAECKLTEDCEITVVMGSHAPHLASVQRKALSSNLNIRVLSGASNMAELMVNADLAIGAAGSTSWERCCLGLPTVMVVLAENQQMIANQLSDIGACKVMAVNALERDLPDFLEDLSEAKLKHMVEKAQTVCKGDGVELITRMMFSRRI